MSPVGVRLSVKNTFWSVEDEDEDEDETWIGTQSCVARMSMFEDDCSPSDLLGAASTGLTSVGVTSVGVTSVGVASSSWEGPGASTPAGGSPRVVATPVVRVFSPCSFLREDLHPSQEATAAEATASEATATETPAPAASQNRSRIPEPSLGSVGHGTVCQDGKPGCEPCAWFWRPGACVFAGDCKFCHMCPENELKRRKKEKVMRMRKLDREAKQGAIQKQLEDR